MYSFSIIIPVYNGEKYLSTCIQEINKQTYKDFEIIVVDDGSSDKTFEIANQILASQNNVKVIKHEKNSGLASSRNDGILSATGKWIMFLDVDDFYDVHALERVNGLINNCGEFDLALFPYIERWITGKEFLKNTKILNGAYTTREICKLLLNDLPYQVLSCVGAKVYRSEFLKENKILFDDSQYKFNEDGAFILGAIRCAHRIAYFDEPFYIYMKYGSGTIMTSYRRDMLTTLTNVQKLLQLVLQENDAYSGTSFMEFHNRSYAMMVDSLRNEVKFSDYNSFKNEVKKIKNNELFHEVLQNSNGITKRIVLFSINKRFSLLLYLLFCLKYGRGAK